MFWNIFFNNFFLILVSSNFFLIRVGLISKPPFAIIAYPFANCSGVVVIPCPNETVANLHFPHLKGIGSPTSSRSKSILFKTPIFSKNDFNLSISSFWPILTEPILPDLIKICSTVRFDGIFLSYSEIIFFPHLICFFKFLNFVSGSTAPSWIPAASVKVFKTEPNSYTPFVALFMYFLSIIFILWS